MCVSALCLLQPATSDFWPSSGSSCFFLFLGCEPLHGLPWSCYMTLYFPAWSWPGHWPHGSSRPHVPSRYPAWLLQVTCSAFNFLSPSFSPFESITRYAHILTNKFRFPQPRTHPGVSFLGKSPSVMTGSNRCVCALPPGSWWLLFPAPTSRLDELGGCPW